MINSFIQHLSKYISLDQKDLDLLHKLIPVLEFKKTEVILDKGQVSKAFYFVLEGCLRLSYPINENEKTAYFYFENSFVSSYESFIKQIPSKHRLSALEDCKLVEISTESAQALLAHDRKFDTVARIIMEEELAQAQSIIASFVSMDAKERYLQLQTEQPELIQRIPQQYLASYIGVSPETLSRIRRRIVES